MKTDSDTDAIAIYPPPVTHKIMYDTFTMLPLELCDLVMEFTGSSDAKQLLEAVDFCLCRCFCNAVLCD